MWFGGVCLGGWMRFGCFRSWINSMCTTSSLYNLQFSSPALTVSCQKAIVSFDTASPNPRDATIPLQTSSTTNSGVGTGLVHPGRKGFSCVCGSQHPFVRESADSQSIDVPRGRRPRMRSGASKAMRTTIQPPWEVPRAKADWMLRADMVRRAMVAESQ